MQYVTASLEKVQAELDLGNYRFKVYMATTNHDGRKVYYITMPFDLRKNKWLDQVLDSVFASGGRLTARGQSLIERLNGLEDVEASSDDLNRQLIAIYAGKLDEEPERPLASALIYGLRRDIAEVLQSA